MKTLILALVLATPALAQAEGRCVAYDPQYQPYCAKYPVDLACNAQTNICQWLKMSTQRPVIQSVPSAR